MPTVITMELTFESMILRICEQWAGPLGPPQRTDWAATGDNTEPGRQQCDSCSEAGVKQSKAEGLFPKTSVSSSPELQDVF